ncbi:hypothetical protein CKM354_001292100 [Cercospora kikuchii]|uniref:Uncharacterized protein n=1 Tax=Cercospora kikuchii TaxID=84275 RepID=A0A9P3FMX6_9PEZI|nr:uncharacterized protein CKM354_001292100 [Cercospora kikuchii]GIZ49904.1 hypothetical protein CKM354_001292100 [Cercospora kikuchii]
MQPSTSTLTTILLFLSSLHPTTARVQIRTYTSPTTTSNSTALLSCVNQLHADLQANPRARAMPGYVCGDSTFYHGTPGLGGATGESDLYVVEKCERDMTERAKEGRDWFECRVRAAWGERRVGWKANGQEEEEEEQELRDLGERDVIDEEGTGEEEDEEEEFELLEDLKERNAELGDAGDEDDEIYEFEEAGLEEVDWHDEIDGEGYGDDVEVDDEEDDEQI